MKNVNDAKNEPILNNEYTNDTNDRSPQRESSTPITCSASTTSNISQNNITVEPFQKEPETQKQNLSENKKSEVKAKLL